MENNKGRKKKEIGFDSPFATRLRELLTETNTTQPTLAAAVGVSRQAVGQWKDGNTVPDILDFQKIADYFGVSLEYLAGRSENKTTNIKVQAICDYTCLTEKTIKTLHDNINEDNTDPIATLALRIEDKDNKYCYIYYYIQNQKVSVCLNELLSSQEGIELLSIIDHYIKAKSIDSIDINSVILALNSEITERLKTLRNKKMEPPRLQLDLDKLFDF